MKGDERLKNKSVIITITKGMTKLKRFISMMLALLMLISMLPVNAIASETGSKPMFAVQNTSAAPNSDVSVNVNIENNVGILGTTLKVTFDEGLTLVSAQSGEAFSYLTMTKPGKLVSPCKFVWDGLEYDQSDLHDGTILTLNFKVSENAADGDEYNISLSVGSSDVYDNDIQPVSVTTKNGKVTIVDFTPGDVNEDDLINTADIILMRRYIAEGYDVSINRHAANVNADSYINTADVITLRRYIAEGYDVQLKRCPTPCPLDDEPDPPVSHTHKLRAVALKNPTCTEAGNTAYWICDGCGKYYTDANGVNETTAQRTVLAASGHHIVTIPATATSTEGAKCSICGLVTKEPEPIEQPINTRRITYHIANGDSYLSSQKITNPKENKEVLKTTETLTLKNPSVPGYRFLGWYDLPSGSNASIVKKIEAGEDDVELYAHWEAIKYTVQFESSLQRAEFPTSRTYTVNAGTTLPTLSLSNYAFAGWSDLDGNLYKRIPIGTTGDITLIANWTSERNKTWTKTKLDAPIIVEDDKEGVIMFAYEIGTIENVPLYSVHDFGYISEDGVSKQEEVTFSVKTDETLMETYAKTVANATTNSSSWTLSNDWNETTSLSESWRTENEMTKEEAETLGRSDSQNWNVSSGTSGSSSTSTMSSNSNSENNEVKIAASNESNVKTHVAAGLDTSTTTSAEASVTASAKAKYPGAEAGVSATAKTGVTSTVSTSLSATRDTDDTRKQSLDIGHANSNVNVSSATSSSTSGWNQSSSYGGSSTTSSSKTSSTALREAIAEEKGYGKSYAQSSGTVSYDGTSHTLHNQDEYSSTVTFNTTTQKEVKKTWKTENTKAGYHRWIKVGKAHVFGVVSYDIANQAYFVSTYSVMDDEIKDFEDYSLTTSSFNDNENGVITFEVPDEVTDYVADRVAHSDGLRIQESTGTILRYEGNDDFVIIPEYITPENGGKPVKVTGISSDAFKGNANIKAVILSDYITEIPNEAFMGCTALYCVGAKNVTSIGDNAFAGCTNYVEADISEAVTKLGKNAFDGIENLYVVAANKEVALNALTSDAKTVALYLNKLNDADGNNALSGTSEKPVELVTPNCEKFAINGYGGKFNDTIVKSGAGETYLLNCKFNSTGNIPLYITSEKLVMDKCKVSANGIAMVLDTEKTELGLQGDIIIETGNENAMLCKNLKLYEFDSIATGTLTVNGKLIVCGEIEGKQFLHCDNIQYVDEETFQKYLHSYTLTFNANGGSCGEVSREVPNDTKIGKLPDVSRQYYNFEGWFTKADGGDAVDENTVFSNGNDVIIYAHWSPKRFTVTFDANGGWTEQNSRELAYGDKLGALPNAGRDYYDFVGWFTEPDGGTQVDANLVFGGVDNVTLYAHWNQHGVSDWVRESDMPSGAQVVEQKWGYNETSYTESTATSMGGWERYDGYWVKSGSGSFNYASFPSGFDTGNWYYNNYQRSAVGAYQNETNKREVSTGWGGYIYWHWMYDCGGANGTSSRAILPYKGTGPVNKFAYKYFGAFNSTTNYPSGGTGYTENTNTQNYIVADRTAYADCQGATRWFRFDYYWCNYTDYYAVYKYRKTDYKESSSQVNNGGNISNVIHYVRYRAK